MKTWLKENSGLFMIIIVLFGVVFFILMYQQNDAPIISPVSPKAQAVETGTPAPTSTPPKYQSFIYSPYDLNGDGLVTEADLIKYRELFDSLNFNGDSQVDIFDQTMIAAEAQQPISKIYLPIIAKKQ